MADPQAFTWEDHDKTAAPAAQPQSFTWDDDKSASAGPRVVAHPQTQAQIDQAMGPQSMWGQLGRTFSMKGVGDTLGREVKTAGQTVTSAPSALYHAATDPVTEDEKKMYGPTEGPNAHWYKPNMNNIGPTGRVIVRTLGEPVDNAIQDYAKGRVSISDVLNNAPEALGTAGGTVLAGKAAEGVGETAKAAVKGEPVKVLRSTGPTSTEIISDTKRAQPALRVAGKEFIGDTKPGTVGGDVPLPFRGITEAPVRAAAKTVNIATQKLPEVAGAGIGATIGDVVAGPQGSLIGGGAGAAFGRSMRGIIPKVPGEDFGLTTMDKSGVESPAVTRIQDEPGVTRAQGAGLRGEGQRPLSPSRIERIITGPERAAARVRANETMPPATLPRTTDLTQHESINPNLSTDQVKARIQNPSVQADAAARNQQMIDNYKNNGNGNGAKPNIGQQWTTPEYQDITSGIKRVGRAGESKAARAITEQTGEGSQVSLGQFAQVNGARMDAAVPATPEGQTLANHIHSMTGPDIEKVAKQFDVKPEYTTTKTGKQSLNRQATFNKMLDAGKTPENIVDAHNSRLANPKSVSGGSQSAGEPRVRPVESTVDPQQFLNKVAPGQSMEYKLGLDKQTGKPIPDMGKLIEDYKSGKEIPAIEIHYDADGNVTGADGIKRAMAARVAGVRPKIKIFRSQE